MKIAANGKVQGLRKKQRRNKADSFQQKRKEEMKVLPQSGSRQQKKDK